VTVHLHHQRATKTVHNGDSANARFIFYQLNSNIVNNIISTKALT